MTIVKLEQTFRRLRAKSANFERLQDITKLNNRYYLPERRKSPVSTP